MKWDLTIGSAYNQPQSFWELVLGRDFEKII